MLGLCRLGLFSWRPKISMGEGRATVSSRLLRLGLKEMQVLYLHHKKTHLHSIRLASDNLIWTQINLFTSGQTKRKIKSLEFYKKLVVAGFFETIEEKDSAVPEVIIKPK